MPEKPKPANANAIVIDVDPVGLDPRRRAELAREEFARMEDDIAAKAMFVLDGALSFLEVEPPGFDEEGERIIPEAPPQWIEELERQHPGQGERLANMKLRAALAAHLPSKEAPIGLKMAQGTAVGIARARAGEKKGNKSLNVQIVQVVESKSYEELEVEERK